MLKEFTDSNFSHSIKNGKVIVDFYSKECVPCKVVEQKLIQLKKEKNGELIIGRVDVGNNPQLTAQFCINCLPTLLLFENGRPMEQINGNVSLNKIKKRFNLE